MMTGPKSGQGVIFPALQIAICQIYSTDKSLSLFLGPPDDGDHHQQFNNGESARGRHLWSLG